MLNGAPVRIVNPAGDILWAAGYSPTGEVVKIKAQELDNPLRLQGQYFDEETGLCYNRYRYFDGKLGAYISADPLKLAAGVNLYVYGVNLYVYGVNLYVYGVNSLTWTDPLGLMCRKKKSIWSSTRNRTSVENAFEHFKKHGNEFPEIKNAKQYVEKANDFLKNPSKDTLTKIRKNGDILRYNSKSNTFGVLRKDGAPRTMFKPNDGINYWNRQ